MAFRMTWLAAEKPEASNEDFSRRRMPMGGALALLELDAQ
jgi:hypothetical protein